MPPARDLILGEHRRSLDERFRLSLPAELVEPLLEPAGDCILAKERSGCLSLWNAAVWQAKLTSGMDLVKAKIQAGRLDALDDVQLLGRLLSTRHVAVQLAGRGDWFCPRDFASFLGVEAGGEVMVVGAAVCIEIWRMDAWTTYLDARMPEFRRLLDELSG